MQQILTERFVSSLPDPLRHLPPPDEAAIDHMQRLHALLLAETAAEGFLPFSRFMELALYAP